MIEKLTERKKKEMQATESAKANVGKQKVPDSEFIRMMGNKVKVVKK